MVKGIKNVFFGGEGLFDTVVTGPGRLSADDDPAAHRGLLAPFLPKSGS
jgi:hypothetical protein